MNIILTCLLSIFSITSPTFNEADVTSFVESTSLSDSYIGYIEKEFASDGLYYIASELHDFYIDYIEISSFNDSFTYSFTLKNETFHQNNVLLLVNDLYSILDKKGVLYSPFSAIAFVFDENHYVKYNGDIIDITALTIRGNEFCINNTVYEPLANNELIIFKNLAPIFDYNLEDFIFTYEEQPNFEQLLKLVTLIDDIDGKINERIEINAETTYRYGNLPGKYLLSLSGNDHNLNTNTVEIEIWIIDNISPVIQTLHNDPVLVSVNECFDFNHWLTQNLIVFDNVDDINVENYVIITDNYTENKDIEGIYFIRLAYHDSSNNKSYFELEIHVVQDAEILINIVDDGNHIMFTDQIIIIFGIKMNLLTLILSLSSTIILLSIVFILVKKRIKRY